MLFNSVEFLVFFTVVFGAFWLLPYKNLRVILLLVASYYFYMSWNAKLAAVVATTSLVDYFIANLIERNDDQKIRKRLLVGSILMNLGLLIYFKYMNFFLESLGQLLHGLGMSAEMPFLKVILPIGISFYTFEAISYTTDVYWRRTTAEKNPVNFLLFITFFPRMIAGPIIRAKTFLPQLHRDKRFDWGRFDLGLQMVLMGLFKKIVIADRMAYLVDPVYANPTQYSTGAVWVALVAYSLQIYCDFSGYSDIAIGTAHMLGFKLPENFNMPYMSRNIAEFWRRWHISLSTWLRDYVFQTLGGGRRSQSKMSTNMVITMTLCGLWHGANWTFVVFGVSQGILLLWHHSFRNFCKRHRSLKRFLETIPGIVLRVLVTYVGVSVLPGVLFRSQTFHTVGEVFHRAFVPHRGLMVRDPVGPWSLIFAFSLIAVCHVTVESGLWKKIAPRINVPAWAFIYAAMVALICALRIEGHKAFIYFQF